MFVNTAVDHTQIISAKLHFCLLCGVGGWCLYGIVNNSLLTVIFALLLVLFYSLLYNFSVEFSSKEYIFMFLLLITSKKVYILSFS